jgi:hypothetical protein
MYFVAIILPNGSLMPSGGARERTRFVLFAGQAGQWRCAA